MSSKTCERCGGSPPAITGGPWAGSRHELRYCVFCSKDLCEKCLEEGKCRETKNEDKRHRVEVDCGECPASGPCTTCESTGTIIALVGGS